MRRKIHASTSPIVVHAVDAGWEDFVTEYNEIYPAAEYTNATLQRLVRNLLTNSRSMRAARDFSGAGEMYAEARAVAALLTERGTVEYEPAQASFRTDLRRMVTGIGPEPLRVNRTDYHGVGTWVVMAD